MPTLHRPRACAAVIAIASAIALAQPAAAETCPYHAVSLTGGGQGFRIARPDGREMCFTIAKSRGLSDGRITVVTVRPLLNASAGEMEVLATQERTLAQSTGSHHKADISAPDMLRGAQVFFNADDTSHITLRVRPRHTKDYRLVVVVHEIDVPKVVMSAAGEAIAAVLLAEIIETMAGKDRAKMPLLDHRVQSVVQKSFFGVMRGHSTEQIVADVAVGLALTEIMAGQDVPRNARIAVAIFLMHAWRELSRGATSAVGWDLPETVRDTSRPQSTSLR